MSRRLHGALLCAAALWLGGANAATTQPPAPAPDVADARRLAEDFDTAWRAIDSRYAYMEQQRAAWRRAREAWRPKALAARSRQELVAALEGAIAELRDDHVSLSERTPASRRAVPAETDVWASWKDGLAVVDAVRTFGDADVAGLRPGHVITEIAGVPVERAVESRLGKPAGRATAERDWALRHVLAGPRSGTLRVEVREHHARRELEIERRDVAPGDAPPLIARRMGEDRDLGYIRFKRALSDERLVAPFDAALDHLADTRALILDLREVTGPGDHDVTRAILGRFVSTERPWQIREVQDGGRVVDKVAPRGRPYRAPVLVLVDRWTAGEGEALAAGMAAAAGARLVGTRMAGLRGELAEVALPHSGLVLRFPAQKTFHVDGTPRELLAPHIAVDLAAPDGGPGDPILYQALKNLETR